MCEIDSDYGYCYEVVMKDIIEASSEEFSEKFRNILSEYASRKDMALLKGLYGAYTDKKVKTTLSNVLYSLITKIDPDFPSFLESSSNMEKRAIEIYESEKILGNETTTQELTQKFMRDYGSAALDYLDVARTKFCE